MVYENVHAFRLIEGGRNSTHASRRRNWGWRFEEQTLRKELGRKGFIEPPIRHSWGLAPVSPFHRALIKEYFAREL